MGAPRLHPALFRPDIQIYCELVEGRLIAKPGNDSWLAGGGRRPWGRQGCAPPCECLKSDASRHVARMFLQNIQQKGISSESRHQVSCPVCRCWLVGSL